MQVVSSAIVDKYIGESARVVREMFGWCGLASALSLEPFNSPLPSPPSPLPSLAGYARDHEPCIIFMDEIDAIGGRRFSEGTSADREIQRTLMELLNQMDGFDSLGQVKIIMATNRPDTLDPALLRPGRLDRKIGLFVCVCVKLCWLFWLFVFAHLLWTFCCLVLVRRNSAAQRAGTARDSQDPLAAHCQVWRH